MILISNSNRTMWLIFLCNFFFLSQNSSQFKKSFFFSFISPNSSSLFNTPKPHVTSIILFYIRGSTPTENFLFLSSFCWLNLRKVFFFILTFYDFSVREKTFCFSSERNYTFCCFARITYHYTWRIILINFCLLFIVSSSWHVELKFCNFIFTLHFFD